MSNTVRNTLFIMLLGFCSSQVFADANEALKNARINIVKHFTGVDEKNITQSEIKGLYKVLAPPRIFYASEDGRYIFDGDVIDMQTRQNITQKQRNQALSMAVESLGEESMIIFGNKTLKHTVTVFTDIDCTYCRKLHNEIAQYNKLGIRVRYLAYPRAGINSASSKKADDVWCSKNKKQAMTDAKNGKPVKSEKCDSPVAKHFALGNLMGLRGTPAIVLGDGNVVPGYVPAQRLSEALNNPELHK